MTEREMAAVLLAYANGAAVQSKSHYRSTAKWRTMGIAIWQFSDYDYRVRPKPREWIISGGIAFEVKPPCDLPSEGIHVREVLEDES